MGCGYGGLRKRCCMLIGVKGVFLDEVGLKIGFSCVGLISRPGVPQSWVKTLPGAIHTTQGKKGKGHSLGTKGQGRFLGFHGLNSPRASSMAYVEI